MNDLAEQQPCTLCQSNRGILIETRDRHGGPLDVMMCGGCGFVHNHPIPTQEDLTDFYSLHYRKVYKKVLLPKLKHAVRYFPGATRHILTHRDLFRNTRSVLDAGCGSGEFLYLMAGLDKKVTGIEPNVGYSEFCRLQLGLPVVTGEICSYEPTAKFDHIRLNHVLEHLRNPLECLTLLRGWLTEHGHLYVRVPDFENACRSKSPGGIFHFGHIFNFDRHSFDRITALAGLKIIRRMSNTAAFLAPDLDARPPAVPTLDEIRERAATYARHRNSPIVSQRTPLKLWRKMSRAIHEQLICLSATDHRSLGDRFVINLRRRIGTAATPSREGQVLSEA